MTWFDDCYKIVSEKAKELPDDATEKQIRAHLRPFAWAATMGTSWGKKSWCKAINAYLVFPGLKQSPVKTQKTPQKPVELPLFDK